MEIEAGRILLFHKQNGPLLIKSPAPTVHAPRRRRAAYFTGGDRVDTERRVHTEPHVMRQKTAKTTCCEKVPPPTGWALMSFKWLNGSVNICSVCRQIHNNGDIKFPQLIINRLDLQHMMWH